MPDTPMTRAGKAPTLSELEDHGAFERRHVGPSEEDQAAMLAVLGYRSRAALIDAVIPRAIRRAQPMEIGAPLAEAEALGAAPEQVNQDAYAAWIFRVKPDDAAPFEKLLDAAAYEKIASN